MDARSSSSSSPDPLEYPGDPKFLLSSATKSLSRRPTLSPQKSPSPQRRSQSPSKSNAIKPLKFSDVVLPSTPSGRGRGRSASPSKATMQSEGNVSPWRIRVTVEAEREDEEEEFMNGIQNGLGLGTTTTKVPLKGGESSAEPTPKRRKTPGKSAVTDRPPTPKRRKSNQQAVKASPGNTPKRRPGRPRKSLQSIDPNVDTPKAAPPDPSPKQPTPQNGDPFLDIAMDHGVSDGMPTGDLDAVTSSEHPDEVPVPHMTEPLQGTPEPAPVEENNSQEDELIAQTSPISQRQHPSSPENTLHAGHTPKRTSRHYPTPTPSSLVDEEGAENRSHPSPRDKSRLSPPSTTRRLKDPTAEHREFDTIVEGEEFSMVSLDTLPSAKQQLSGAAKAGLNAASEVLSTGQRSRDQSRIDEPPETMTASPHQTARTEAVQTQAYPFTGDAPHLTTQFDEESSVVSEVQAANALSSQQTPLAVLRKRKPLSRLARVIRAGIAFRGLLNGGHDGDAAKQRLDRLFSDFDIDTQRALRAGLLFGNEMTARREVSMERQEENQTTHPEEAANDGSILSSELGPPPKITSTSNMSRDQTPTPKQISTNTLEERMTDEMARRQAEWQREREAISREIEEANSSRVIIIDDTNDIQDSTDDADREGEMAARDDDAWDREEEVHDDDHDRQPETVKDELYAEDDGVEGKVHYEAQDQQAETMGDELHAEDDDQEEEEDIWQQAAQQKTPKFGRRSPVKKFAFSPKSTMPPRLEIQDYLADPQPIRASQFAMLTAGKTQMAKYRDGDFEFSSFLGTPESATRRFYQDDVVAASNENVSSSPQDGLQSARPQRFQASSPIAEGPEPESEPEPEPEPDQTFPSSPPLYQNETAHDRSPPERSPPYEVADYGDGNEIHVDTEYLHVGDEAANYRNASVTYDSGSSEPVREDDDIAEEGQYESAALPPAPSPPPAPLAPPAPLPPAKTHAQPGPNVVRGVKTVGRAPQTERLQAVQPSAPPSSWFSKLADFAPSWLTSKIAEGLGTDNTEATTLGPQEPTQADTIGWSRRHQYVDHSTQASRLSPPNPRPRPKRRHKSYIDKPLALGGYWTDDHFVALSRLYDRARKHPERFPYEPTPERDEMLGQWLETVDGEHRRQVSEFYIAVVSRFANDLVEASRRRGGSDKLEYTEMDLVWNLWRIIIGRKIRRARKLAYRVGNS